MRRLLSSTILLSTGLLASACTVGPDYVRPAVAVPKAYKEAPPGWIPARPADRAQRGPWWQLFHDPDLDRLEAQAIRANPGIIAADAHYRQALAVVDQNVASLFPVVSLRAYEQRLTNPAVGVPLPPRTYRSASISASWVPDLWGAIRRSIEEARANAASSADTLGAAMLSLQATLATDYFALRIADQQRRLLDESVRADQRALAIVRNRYRGGVAARTDVAQAQAQLAEASTQAIDIGIQRAQLEHAIAVLTGNAPALFAIAPRGTIPAPPRIPPEIPASLLQRRPDVASAERLAAAANAQIGVAQSAFFPTVTLSARGGYRAANSMPLFAIPGRFWALGPYLAQTIFDGGARNALKQQAIAGYDAAVATYRQTVLTALQNVEDALVALRVLQQESIMENAAVDDAEDTVRMTANQYRGGTTGYLNVISARTTMLADRAAALNIRGRRLAASVALIAALGGDWSRPADTPGSRQP